MWIRPGLNYAGQLGVPRDAQRRPDCAGRGQGSPAVKMLGAIAGVQRMAIPGGNTIRRAVPLGATRFGTPGGRVRVLAGAVPGLPDIGHDDAPVPGLESLRDAEGQ